LRRPSGMIFPIFHSRACKHAQETRSEREALKAHGCTVGEADQEQVRRLDSRRAAAEENPRSAGNEAILLGCPLGPVLLSSGSAAIPIVCGEYHIVAQLRRPSEDQVTPAGGQQPLSGKKVSPAPACALIARSAASILVSGHFDRAPARADLAIALPLNV